MERLFKLASLSGALLVVFLAAMAVTAKTSVAQNAKAPSDVRVVNAATEPVPVSVIGTHSVNVANTPNVNVTSLPAVQVGNAAANPIPVTVQNFPAAQQAPQPVSLYQQISVPANQLGGSFVTVYTVPAGKRLIIDFVSFIAFPQQGESCLLSVATADATTQAGTPPGGWFGAEATTTNRQTCAEMSDIVVDPGMEVHLTMTRDKLLAFETLMDVRISGRLYNVSS